MRRERQRRPQGTRLPPVRHPCRPQGQDQGHALRGLQRRAGIRGAPGYAALQEVRRRGRAAARRARAHRLEARLAVMDLELAQLPPLERYKLLIGLVIPRPIAWISTRSPNGIATCAPFSFFNVFSEAPPLCVIGINPRSDGAMKHTLKAIRRTREFVVNLVDEATANAMHISSTDFAGEVSEFDKAGLASEAAVMVLHTR